MVEWVQPAARSHIDAHAGLPCLGLLFHNWQVELREHALQSLHCKGGQHAKGDVLVALRIIDLNTLPNVQSWLISTLVLFDQTRGLAARLLSSGCHRPTADLARAHGKPACGGG